MRPFKKGDKVELTGVPYMKIAVGSVGRVTRVYGKSTWVDFGHKEIGGRHHRFSLVEAADGFIPWNGGACPVAPGVKVDYHMGGRTKGPSKSQGNELRWDHKGNCSDITAYRVVAEKCSAVFQVGDTVELLEDYGVTKKGSHGEVLTSGALIHVKMDNCQLACFSKRMKLVNRPVAEKEAPEMNRIAVEEFMKTSHQFNNEPQAQEKVMKTFTSVQLINGKDATTFTKDDLIGEIADAESQIKALEAIETDSTTIRAKIKDLRVFINKVVKTLDKK